jgi:hypothetical protein
MTLNFTRKEIVDMAKKAGLESYPKTRNAFWAAEIVDIEDFAELIAAAIQAKTNQRERNEPR